MNKITVNLIGPGEICLGNFNYGLGNQLFQIAAVLSYAKDNNFDAIFPVLNDREKYGSYVDNIFRKINTEELNREVLIFREHNSSYIPIPKYDKSILIVDSYLQSEKYFSHNRDYILDMFSSRERDIEYIENKYGSILRNERTISLHIRRGDYTKLANHYFPLWESDYYNNAIENLEDGKLIIFSDDVEWCRKSFKDKEVIYIQEEDYMELYVMSMCTDNIIANSTFSWWGAWMNKNKKVIAPSNWFGTDDDKNNADLIPQDWIII